MRLLTLIELNSAKIKKVKWLSFLYYPIEIIVFL